MDDHQVVSEKYRKRFEVLKAIYRDTNGEELKASLLGEIKEIVSISTEELVNILRYLEHQGLIKVLSAPYDDSDTVPIQILHQGVIEVEAAITRPSEPTEHFPAQVFHITNNASVSAQQFGNQNTLNNFQQNDLINTAAEIQQLLQLLEQSYPSETLPQKATLVEEAVKRIESKPTLKQRVTGVIKSAGTEAFKEAVDHPLINIFVAGIEGWLQGN